MNSETWIMLPPARKGAKCPVSGWSRRKLQQLIYGIPGEGIKPQVKHKHVAGGRGDKGRIYINVPSLRRHMLGESEVTQETLDTVSVLSQSPDWCQTAINSLITLIQDRAGLSAADFLTYLKSTRHELRNDLRPDSDPPGSDHSAGAPANPKKRTAA